jgi:uncharacterized membrane protein YqhA
MKDRLRHLISKSRYLIVIPSFGAFLAATTLLIYATVEILHLVQVAIQSPLDGKTGKILTVAFIEAVDLYLLGTVFYIIAIGLYELFIDDQLALPAWLEIHTLDDLKNKLTGVVIAVMAVLFLGQVVTWDGQRDLLGYGTAVALVIAALSYFLSQRKKGTVE